MVSVIERFHCIHFHMERFNFVGFMVIALCFFKNKNKKKKMKNRIRRWRTWQKCGKHFWDISCITNQPIFVYWLTLKVKSKVKMNNILILMGIDHSNPYMHSVWYRVYFPRGAPINTESSTSMTPLMLAALNGHGEVSMHYTPTAFAEMSIYTCSGFHVCCYTWQKGHKSRR